MLFVQSTGRFQNNNTVQIICYEFSQHILILFKRKIKVLSPPLAVTNSGQIVQTEDTNLLWTFVHGTDFTLINCIELR